jgi:hypothetical protein
LVSSSVIEKVSNDYVLVKVNINDVERIKLLEGDMIPEVRMRNTQGITNDQKKFINVIIYYIAQWYGDTPFESLRDYLKYEFGIHNGVPLDSLTMLDKTEASQFIDMLVNFALKHNIELPNGIANMAPEQGKWQYYCLMHKVCCICGKPHADLHHVDTVGMGSNRNHIDHKDKLSMSLCRIHHVTLEQEGSEKFFSKYKVTPIKINEKIAKVHKLKYGI